MVAFPRQFEGLPAILVGQIRRAVPTIHAWHQVAPTDASESFSSSRRRPIRSGKRGGSRTSNARRRICVRPRPFEGFAVHEMDIFWPNDYRAAALRRKRAQGVRVR